MTRQQSPIKKNTQNKSLTETILKIRRNILVIFEFNNNSLKCNNIFRNYF